MPSKHIEIPEADYLAMREEIEQLREAIGLYEAMKEGVSVRIADLEATNAKQLAVLRLCDAYFSFSKMLSGGYAESSINRLGIANEMKWKAEKAIAECLKNTSI